VVRDGLALLRGVFRVPHHPDYLLMVEWNDHEIS
jgi:hypothetical protein